MTDACVQAASAPSDRGLSSTTPVGPSVGRSVGSVAEAKNDLGRLVVAGGRAGARPGGLADEPSLPPVESVRIRCRRPPRGPRLIHASAVVARVKFRKLRGRAKWSFVRPGEHIR